MMVPTPIFALEDWALVWLWPTLMAIVFGVFVRDRDVIKGGDRRPMIHRFLSSFVLFASLWIPCWIVSNAIGRGAEAQAQAQGIGWSFVWGFGTGVVAMVLAFTVLLTLSRKIPSFGLWLGLNPRFLKGLKRK